MFRLLWIDNDVAHIQIPVLALKEAGFVVDTATTVSEAERLISDTRYDLVILDVMIPVTAAEDTSRYSAEITDNAHKTGLVFYRLHAKALSNKDTRVVVLTVRIDEVIRNEFLAAGLPETFFRTKLEMRHTPKFISFVQQLLASEP